MIIEIIFYLCLEPNKEKVMKRVFVFVVSLLVLGSLARVNAQEKETLVKVGDDVPEFVVEMFDGQKINIKDLKGKIVLINFWATWCPPCQEELKRVQKEILDRFKGKDFVFLAISREESKEQVKKFRERNGYTFPMGLDPERTNFIRSLPRQPFLEILSLIRRERSWRLRSVILRRLLRR